MTPTETVACMTVMFTPSGDPQKVIRPTGPPPPPTVTRLQAGGVNLNRLTPFNNQLLMGSNQGQISRSNLN